MRVLSGAFFVIAAALAASVVATTVLAAPPATARAHAPLVSSCSSDFAVRPTRIVAANDGSSFVGYRPGKGGTIRWKKWTGTVARGTGTYWISDFIPYAAAGMLHPHTVVIIVSRVRNGHFTRVTFRYRAGDRGWDKGDELHVEHWKLHRLIDYYTWGA